LEAKKTEAKIEGATSLALTGTSLVLMIVGGPTGMLCGGFMLGAGLSGLFNTFA